MYAIINAAASRGKGKKGKLPKVEDLFKRPSDSDVIKAEKTEDDIREEIEHTSEWLSQFDFSKFDEK